MLKSFRCLTRERAQSFSVVFGRNLSKFVKPTTPLAWTSSLFSYKSFPPWALDSCIIHLPVSLNVIFLFVYFSSP